MALGLEQKALGIGVLILWGLLCGPAMAANSSKQVCLKTDQSTPMLAEASLRVEGELKAAGFELLMTETQEGQIPCPPEASSLVLTPKAGNLEITAQVPSRPAPLVQLVDVSSPKTTSEIVAVRAVETLRAAAIEALAAGDTPSDPTWVQFAQGAPAPPSEKPPQPAATPTPQASGEPSRAEPAAAPPATEPSFRSRHWAMGVGLGPSGTADSVAAAVALSVDYHLGSISLGVRGRASLSSERTDAPQASLLIRSYGLEARALWFPYRDDQVELALGAQAGLAHARMDAIESIGPPQGFDGASHSTLALGAGLAVGYRLVQDLSLRAEGWVNGWTDAPHVDLAGSQVVLGRPEWLVTFGPVFLR